MNIVFFGSSEFAVPSLRAFVDKGFEVLCVVTQPDKRQGRGLSVAGTAVKTASGELQLPVYQPQDVNAPASIEYLKKLCPDVFVVVAYGQILSREVLAIPSAGAINAHASLLPKYRGAAPISWALINGEKQTGVTVIRMSEKMDAGPVILQGAVAIGDDDDEFSLEEKLAAFSADLLIEAAALIESGNSSVQPQDPKQATYASKLARETGRIRWDCPSEEIRNLVRGCVRWPGAFTSYRGKLLKIYRAGARDGDTGHAVPGTVTGVHKDVIEVSTARGTLMIEELQVEGGRRMSAAEFIAGHRLRVGERFGE